jgi:protein TonB
LVAPPVAATGSAETAGASSSGAGTGAGGTGAGTGGGGAAPAIKLTGEINAVRDFPAASRDKRLGHFVVLALNVGTDGRVHGCRILTPSPDAVADQIVCRLANDRFRFRPARDRNGQPVESLFGWKQRWYRPGET